MATIVRPTDDEAVAYVVEHFRTHDYGMLIMCVGVVPCPEHVGAVDVSFIDTLVDNDQPSVMTVWFEDVGNGPFLYGEW